MNRSVITCCIEIPVTQDTSCALETRLDIHEQVSYYMLPRDTSTQDTSCVLDTRLDIHDRSVITCCIEIPVTQDTSCSLETRLDIHEQVSYYMLYRDTSNTRYVLCLRD